MRPRRTAFVPNMIWGTAIASIVPSQLVACGGSSSEPGPGGGGDHAGMGSAGDSNGQAGAIHGNAGSGYIVLAIGAFGNGGSSFSAGSGGTEVMMTAGTGGSSVGTGGSSAGAGGKGIGIGTAGYFIVLAAAAFGGKSQ